MAKAKDLEVSILLDFYGKILTEKQRTAAELYYNEDLSLSEIAEECGITRQGAQDAIRRAEQQLRAFEEKLRLMERFRSIQNHLDGILENARSVEQWNLRNGNCPELTERVGRIIRLAEAISRDEES